MRWKPCSSSDDVPALVGRDGDGNQPGAAVPERLEGVRVARRLDERAVAARDERAREQADRVLGADRDHDLVGLGRQSLARVAVGERLAQHAQPERVEARLVQVARQLGDGALGGGCHLGQGRQGRLAEVEQFGVEVLELLGGPTRQARDAAGSADAVEVSGVAQARVGGRDGGAAEFEVLGELALRRQPGAERDAAVEDEQPDAVGEREVGRSAGAGTPLARQ